VITLVVEQLRRSVPGGIGRYTTGLLQGLSQSAAAGEPVPEIRLYASRARSRPDPLARFGPEVRTSPLPGPLLTRGWDAGLLRVPKGSAVVHATSMAAPPSTAPLVVTVHDLAWRHSPQSFPAHGLRWHEAALRRLRHRAARIVVPSDLVAADLAGAGIDGGTVSVIPHGVDHLTLADDDAADADTEVLLERLGVKGEFLLSVGTLEPRKNLVRLAAAYDRARRRMPEPWPLVVVGPSGWGGQRLEVGPPGPGAGLVVAGRVDDATLAALYRRARLLVYVPLAEGFGFPPVEAMALGTPVVASNTLPNLGDGDGARVVDPEDVDDIAAALVEVATDEATRARLVVRGRDRVAGLTWRASARAHLDLWTSLSS
jgi:glycosyltransferase involved in cell wall biosynthesis